MTFIIWLLKYLKKSNIFRPLVNPPVSKTSSEVANLIKRKNMDSHGHGVKEFVNLPFYMWQTLTSIFFIHPSSPWNKKLFQKKFAGLNIRGRPSERCFWKPMCMIYPNPWIPVLTSSIGRCSYLKDFAIPLMATVKDTTYQGGEMERIY